MGGAGLRHPRRDAQPPTGTCGTTNVAQGKTATASSSEQGAGTAAGLAVDGNAGTRWASTFADNQWWQVDLGASQAVCNVTLSWEGAYGKAFRVQGSANGTDVDHPVDGHQRHGRHAVDRGQRHRPVPAARPADPRAPATASRCGRSPSRRRARRRPTRRRPDPDPTGPADGKVRVAGSQGNWALLVNGQNWVTKGMTWGPAPAEFPQHAANLKAMGVNTIRTWGTDAGSKVLLDAAAAAGMRTVAGFWLAPGGGPGSGGCPNYVTDATYKASSMNDIVTWVTAYKDHPGVLMWNVGNESLLGLGNCYSGAELEAQRTAYATFVNDAAKRIHQIDPTHPVTSTDAWTGAWPYYKASSPDLDLYGLNSYNAVCDAKATWIAGGYTKPYLITEGGPAGEWEVPTTPTACPTRAPTSRTPTGYTRAWNCIKAHPGVALGATLFHYGNEGDFGGIWFNVKPGNNKRLSYYAIAKAYGGSAGAAGVNTPPTFSSMTVPNSGNVVAGSTFTVNAAASDPNGDPITYNVLLNSKYVNDSGGLAPATFTRSGTHVLGDGPADARRLEGLRVRRGRQGQRGRRDAVVPRGPAGRQRHEHRQGPHRHGVVVRPVQRQLHAGAGHRRRLRHPLGQQLGRRRVDPGRPGLGPVVLLGPARVGVRVRQGLPHRDVERRERVVDPDHGHRGRRERRHPEHRRLGPLRAGARDSPRHRVRLLAVRARDLLLSE